MSDHDAENDGGARKQGRILYVASAVAVLVLVAGAAWMMQQDKTPPPRRVQEPIVVQILPQPPPPPPPPPPQAMPEPKMIEQPKMSEPEKQEEPEKPMDKAADDKDDSPPPGPLALDAEAEGPGDAMGLGSKVGGHGLLDGSGRSHWGWYASIVQQEIETALRNNSKTRNAVMQAQLRVWADSTGRISRVQIVSSSGNTEIDSVLQNEVLPGLRLRQGPPDDMPMPMVTRITVRRPS